MTPAQISEKRVTRLASVAGIAARIGYRRRLGRHGGEPAVVAENRLEQRFEASLPDLHRLSIAEAA